MPVRWMWALQHPIGPLTQEMTPWLCSIFIPLNSIFIWRSARLSMMKCCADQAAGVSSSTDCIDYWPLTQQMSVGEFSLIGSDFPHSAFANVTIQSDNSKSSQEIQNLTNWQKINPKRWRRILRVSGGIQEDSATTGWWQCLAWRVCLLSSPMRALPW